MPKRSDFIAQAKGAFQGPISQSRFLHGNPIKPATLPDGSSLSVVAFVNHGRWVANCPCEDCAGAEVVTTEDPRFFCESCGMYEYDGRSANVIFPIRKTFLAIEDLLLQRRWERTRNWVPGETITDLTIENAEHQIVDPSLLKGGK